MGSAYVHGGLLSFVWVIFRLFLGEKGALLSHLYFLPYLVEILNTHDRVCCEPTRRSEQFQQAFRLQHNANVMLTHLVISREVVLS